MDRILTLDEVLDINGWDVKKALLAFGKGKSNVMEWANSPIVYRKADKRDGPVRAVESLVFPAELTTLIETCNEKSGLPMQLITDDPECFNTLLAHYGKFQNANNYIAVVEPKRIPSWMNLLSGNEPGNSGFVEEDR